jgi:hypothetical protein
MDRGGGGILLFHPISLADPKLEFVQAAEEVDGSAYGESCPPMFTGNDGRHIAFASRGFAIASLSVSAGIHPVEDESPIAYDGPDGMVLDEALSG